MYITKIKFVDLLMVYDEGMIFFFHLLYFSCPFIVVLQGHKQSLTTKQKEESEINVLRSCMSFYWDNIVMVEMVEKTKISI